MKRLISRSGRISERRSSETGLSARTRSYVAAITALVALASVGFLGGAAFASNWLTDGAKKAGDSTVYFDQCDLLTNTHDTFHDNDTHDIESTDITTTLVHSCTVTDVMINDQDYGTSEPTGWYECHAYHSANVCDKGHAHINTSYSNIPEDYNRTLTLVCEEIGHSVGLGHRSEDTSCMGSNLGALHLDSHDTSHLNANY